MLKVVRLIVERFVKQLTISLFFSAMFVFSISLFFKDDLDLVIALVNKINIKEVTKENNNVTIDKIEKRLISYPAYGQIWGTLSLPSINRELNIYNGDSLDILKYGVGRYLGSYYPGEGGTIVIAGHNSRQHFMYLPKMKKNDQIIIKTSYGTFTYKISSTKIIHQSNEAALEVDRNQERLILYTCYPTYTLGLKSERYVIYADLVGEVYE